MTTAFRAHFDGKVIVPEEPVDLPTDCVLEIRVSLAEESETGATGLARLREMTSNLPSNPNAPTPKR